jgi:hypothetical protein
MIIIQGFGLYITCKLHACPIGMSCYCHRVEQYKKNECTWHHSLCCVELIASCTLLHEIWWFVYPCSECCHFYLDCQVNGIMRQTEMWHFIASVYKAVLDGYALIVFHGQQFDSIIIWIYPSSRFGTIQTKFFIWNHSSKQNRLSSM